MALFSRKISAANETSPSFLQFITCCCRRPTATQLDEQDGVGPKDGDFKYGTTEEDTVKLNGSAYAYDEQETSSDSDDEVQKRYQRTIKKTSSQHNVKASTKSHRKDESDGVELKELKTKENDKNYGSFAGVDKNESGVDFHPIYVAPPYPDQYALPPHRKPVIINLGHLRSAKRKGNVDHDTFTKAMLEVLNQTDTSDNDEVDTELVNINSRTLSQTTTLSQSQTSPRRPVKYSQMETSSSQPVKYSHTQISPSQLVEYSHTQTSPSQKVKYCHTQTSSSQTVKYSQTQTSPIQPIKYSQTLTSPLQFHEVIGQTSPLFDLRPCTSVQTVQPLTRATHMQTSPISQPSIFIQTDQPLTRAAHMQTSPICQPGIFIQTDQPLTRAAHMQTSPVCQPGIFIQTDKPLTRATNMQTSPVSQPGIFIQTDKPITGTTYIQTSPISHSPISTQTLRPKLQSVVSQTSPLADHQIDNFTQTVKLETRLSVTQTSPAPSPPVSTQTSPTPSHPVSTQISPILIQISQHDETCKAESLSPSEIQDDDAEFAEIFSKNADIVEEAKETVNDDLGEEWIDGTTSEPSDQTQEKIPVQTEQPSTADETMETDLSSSHVEVSQGLSTPADDKPPSSASEIVTQSNEAQFLSASPDVITIQAELHYDGDLSSETDSIVETDEASTAASPEIVTSSAKLYNSPTPSALSVPVTSSTPFPANQIVREDLSTANDVLGLSPPNQTVREDLSTANDVLGLSSPNQTVREDLSTADDVSGQRRDGSEDDLEKGLTHRHAGASIDGSTIGDSSEDLRVGSSHRDLSSEPVHKGHPSPTHSTPTPTRGVENEGFSREDVASTSRSKELSPVTSRDSSEHAIAAAMASGAEGGQVTYRDDEHLFDVKDLLDREEPPLISKCGSLEVTFDYSAVKSKMTITVHGAREIPAKDRGGANNTQIRMMILPTKRQKHKTKIKTGENPDYNEEFVFSKVPLEDVNSMGLRFRLYGCERMRRERMIGETVVGFASLNLDEPTTHCLALEPRSNLSGGDSKLDISSLSRSDSASSTQSMQHGGMPELLIGLAYNGTTGRMSVEVIKGSNFRNMAMQRAPDTYVKLTLMSPNGQEVARSKTSIRRGQPNPLFKETFMFQVALFQLPDVTLMVSVYNKRSMKRKEMIGWFSLGLNNSGEEELSHWTDMRESKGEQVCRWHVLLES